MWELKAAGSWSLSSWISVLADYVGPVCCGAETLERLAGASCTQGAAGAATCGRLSPGAARAPGHAASLCAQRGQSFRSGYRADMPCRPQAS